MFGIQYWFFRDDDISARFGQDIRQPFTYCKDGQVDINQFSGFLHKTPKAYDIYPDEVKSKFVK